MTPSERPALTARARRWVLWLALVMAAAQSFAAWHVYTHVPVPREQGASKAGHPGGDLCVVCLAAAGIGGAPGPAPAWHLADLAAPIPTPLPPLLPPPGPVARPYAIRGPPLRS